MNGDSTDSTSSFRGRVVHSETGRPLEGVQVVLYDIDPGHRPEELFSLAGDGLADFWNRIPGQRIGSVVTNPSGAFAIRYDPDKLRAGGGATPTGIGTKVAAPPAVQGPSRVGDTPDLLYMILGPETVSDAKTGFPQPPWNRLLYVSLIPVANAGAIEEVRVRIPQASLDRAGVVGKTTHDTLKASWLAAGEIPNAVKTRVAEAREIQAADQSRIAQATSNLSSLTEAQRNSPYFAASPTMREAIATRIESEGLGALARYGERSSSHIRLIGDLGMITLLFGDVPGFGGGSTVSIEGSLCDRLQKRLPGTILERFSGTESDEDATADTEPETGERSPLEIHELVRRELDSMRTNGDGDTANLGPWERVQRAVESVSTDGPSDAVAYRDFHSLQVAFENVWLEAFDSEYSGEVRRLFDEWVRLHRDYGVEPALPTDMSDVNELDAFLNSVTTETEPFNIPVIPSAVSRAWPETNAAQWNALSAEQQYTLLGLSTGRPTDEEIRTGAAIIANPHGRLGRIFRLLHGLRERRNRPHAFHYFAPDSINWGVVTTYRQEWTPDAYQVGELVATLPLAPGEQRVVEQRRVDRGSRRETEEETASELDRRESSSLRRAQSEILDRVETGTQFRQALSGGASFAVGNFNSTTSFGFDKRDESARNKRKVREATLRATAEYRRNHSVEIETSVEQEVASESTITISNPNNEITVTYLFFELERRFRVRERLHRVTPVVLVAQDVPRPEDIDDDWLLAHESILRPGLLDPRFHEAFDLLRTNTAGREASLAIKRAQWEAQRDLLRQVKDTLEEKLAARDVLQELLTTTAGERSLAESREPDDLQLAAEAFFSGGFSLLFGGRDEESSRLEAEREAAETRLEHLGEAVADLQAQLKRATAALETATRHYTKALEKHFETTLLIDQLQVHVKENILVYMSLIWASEPTDQRFLRLYHLQVPQFEPSGPCTIRPARPEEKDAPDLVRGVDGEMYIIECPPPRPSATRVPLHQIADLDHPLGTWGNYLVYPLKECTPITDFMTQEFVDAQYGIRDPDPFGDVTLAQLERFLDEHGPGLTDGERDLVTSMIAHRLAHPLREEETVIIPSGQLFIEALKGEHALLEDYKLAHRALDVDQAAANLIATRLNNIRAGGLLLEGDYSDPDVDRHIVIEGDGVAPITDVTE